MASRSKTTATEEPVAPAPAPADPVATDAPPPMPLIGTAPVPMTPAWLMGIGKVDNIRPANPPGLAGHYVGIGNHGSESEAEHAARLGASAGTATDIGWLLGTIKDQQGTSGGGGAPAQKCNPMTVSVATAPTGVAAGFYPDVVHTGNTGIGVGWKFQFNTDSSGITNAAPVDSSTPNDPNAFTYKIDDILSFPAGKLGAGSSAFTLKVDDVYCENVV